MLFVFVVVDGDATYGTSSIDFISKSVSRKALLFFINGAIFAAISLFCLVSKAVGIVSAKSAFSLSKRTAPLYLA